jgi:hypothetical protein
MSDRGYCPEHGEVELWVACKHIVTGEAEEVWLEPNKIAICTRCGIKAVETIPRGDLGIICEQCLKQRLEIIDVVVGWKNLDKTKLH